MSETAELIQNLRALHARTRTSWIKEAADRLTELSGVEPGVEPTMRRVAVFDANPGIPVAYLRAKSLENPRACIHEVAGRNGEESKEAAIKEHEEMCRGRA